MSIQVRKMLLLPALFSMALGCYDQDKVNYKINAHLIESSTNFVPDILITEQRSEDYDLLKKMRLLFFEADNTNNPQRDVYRRAILGYDGQEIMLLTQDDVRISALYFKRKNAPINIIYVTGYFNDLTPTKEWCAPFAVLFPECNILSFDWRGFGWSEGYHGVVHKNDFGPLAYADIQAAIDFISKENNKPIVVVGFCFGAAMALYAVLEATKEHRRTADALVLDCIFTTFQNQFDRAALAEDRWLQRWILTSGLGQWLLERNMNGSLFSVNPIEMIKAIKVPCYFEHYTYDPFAILHEGIAVYQAATCPKMFMQSNLGRHVRMHSTVPYQYRQSFFLFLKRFGLVPSDYCCS